MDGQGRRLDDCLSDSTEQQVSFAIDPVEYTVRDQSTPTGSPALITQLVLPSIKFSSSSSSCSFFILLLSSSSLHLIRQPQCFHHHSSLVLSSLSLSLSLFYLASST